VPTASGTMRNIPSGMRRMTHAGAAETLIHRGVCNRRMHGQHSHGVAYYRCGYPQEYALANRADHRARNHDPACQERPAALEMVWSPESELGFRAQHTVERPSDGRWPTISFV
jgi:hypothetical protein